MTSPPPAITSNDVQVPRAAERHRDLHDLGRLEPDETEVEPALRPHRDVADDGDGDQQQQPQAVKERRADPHHARRNLGDGHQHAQPEADACCLAEENVHVLACRAVEHDQAGRTDGQHAQQQRPVDVQHFEQAARQRQSALGAARLSGSGDFRPHSSLSPAGGTTDGVVGAAAGAASCGNR
jgi:hypothetical protein